MTEEEWATSTPAAYKRPCLRLLLEFLRSRGTDRKFRLFALACCRRIWHLLPHFAVQQLVEESELVVDDISRRHILDQARVAFESARENSTIAEDDTASLVAFDATQAVECAVSPENACDVALCASDWASTTVADAANNQAVRQIEEEDQCLLLHDIFGNPFHPTFIDNSWLTPDVVALARAVYNMRTLPSGRLDKERLAALADALEVAGCTDAQLLTHCRADGLHVRGCWVVDIILGKK